MFLKLLLASALFISAVGQRDPLLPFITSGSCNVDKQCIRLPHDKCDFDTCDSLFTWKAGSLSGQQVVVYELAGTTLSYSQSSAYLAAVFSADQVRGNDYIVACGWDGSSEFVRLAYQAGDTGKLTIFTEPDRGYVFVRSPEVYFNPENGRISCTFAIQRDRPANKLLPKLSNGASLSYFFFSGIEPYLADFPALGSAPKNSYGPYYISPSEAAVSSEEWHARQKRSPSVAHRAHGILMLISWMWLASIAIVTARYMKTTFGVARDASSRNVKSTYLDGRTWYQIHRALQITAVALTVISFVLLFIVEGRWVGSDYPFLPEFAHPILGCIVMALALLNFVLGWCAPRTLTRERCVWNWFHWLIGSATHCIALPTIFIGMSMRSWAWYIPVILFIWIIFHVLVEILLEIIACCGACACCFKRSKRSDGAVAVSLRDDEEKKDPNSKESKALVFQNADGRRVVMQNKEPSSCACPVGSTCRIVIWSIHVGVTSIVAIVLCFLLALTG